ncbi:MAG: hypothetical protein K2N43_02960 [Lachnospiraceae bacterium]|nr:hypothetical protein [Lachnospiraceae bacterium]
MKKYCRELKIHGIPTEAQIFADANGREWVRMITEGCWEPQTIHKSDRHIHICVNKDASINAAVQQFIPAEKASDERWLEEQMDRMLNSIESSLGLRPDPLLSASNWAGHSSKQLDDRMNEFEKAVAAGETVQALMEINTLANICGYFFNHCRIPELSSHETVNNGYNCAHSMQEEGEDGIGSCCAWSCPFCYPANGSVCSACGVECEESGCEECECEDDYVVASIPEKFFCKSKMELIPSDMGF